MARDIVSSLERLANANDLSDEDAKIFVKDSMGIIKDQYMKLLVERGKEIGTCQYVNRCKLYNSAMLNPDKKLFVCECAKGQAYTFKAGKEVTEETCSHKELISEFISLQNEFHVSPFP